MSDAGELLSDAERAAADADADRVLDSLDLRAALGDDAKDTTKAPGEKTPDEIFDDIKKEAAEKGAHIFATRAKEFGSNLTFMGRAYQEALDHGYHDNLVLQDITRIAYDIGGPRWIRPYLTDLKAKHPDWATLINAELEQINTWEVAKGKPAEPIIEPKPAVDEEAVRVKLEAARAAFAKAKANFDSYNNLVKRLTGAFGQHAHAKTEYEAAKAEYETVRVEFIAGNVERLIDEQSKKIDALVDAGKEFKTKNVVRKIWEGLGNLNANALYRKVTGKEVKPGVLRVLGNIASVRTVLSASLTGLGVGLGEYWWLATAIRGAMSGAGGTFASHDIMERFARRKGAREDLEKLDKVQIEKMGLNAALNLMGEVTVDAQLRGYKVSEISQFKMLQEYILKDNVYTVEREGKEVALTVDELLNNVGQQEQYFDAKAKHNARLRQLAAGAIGAALGTLGVARGITLARGVHHPGAITDHVPKAPAPDHAPTYPHESVPPVGEPHPLVPPVVQEHVIPPPAVETQGILQDPSEGFHVTSGADGHISSLSIELGKDNAHIEHIQQALRRIVVQEMEVKGNTFSALDAQRGEIVVARLKQILEDHKTWANLGSPKELAKLGVHFDGHTLKIDDYGKFSTLLHDKFFAYADKVVGRGNDAYLAEVKNTSHNVWQELLDKKLHAAQGTHPVTVEQFGHDARVLEAAKHVPTETAAHTVHGLGIPGLEVAPSEAGHHSAFDMHLGNDVIHVQGGKAISIDTVRNGEHFSYTLKKPIDLHGNLHNAGETLKKALNRSYTEAIKAASASPEVTSYTIATHEDLMTELSSLGISSGGAVHFGDVALKESWLQKIESMRVGEFVKDPPKSWWNFGESGEKNQAYQSLAYVIGARIEEGWKNLSLREFIGDHAEDLNTWLKK